MVHSLQTLLLMLLATAPPLGGPPAPLQQPSAAAPEDQTCVAIMLPSVEGIQGDGAAFAASVRALFVSYLTGPSLKGLPLDARLVSQAVQEARQKSCGRVLTVAIVGKRSGGHPIAGALGRAAGSAAWRIPVSGVGSAVAMGGAIAGAEAVATAASTTRAKDELRMDYRVTTPDGATILAPKSDKARAKTNGEDLVTPLVAKAAEAIAAAVTRK